MALSEWLIQTLGADNIVNILYAHILGNNSGDVGHKEYVRMIQAIPTVY